MRDPRLVGFEPTTKRLTVSCATAAPQPIKPITLAGVPLRPSNPP